ncbi:MAG: GNAT family N-acetyltransferase [Kofleriaceae bacterium]
MDGDARIREVFLAPVGTLVAARDTQVIERDGWYQVLTPSSGSYHGNEVIYSRLDPASAEPTVRDTIRAYAAHDAPFRWCVGPPTEPAGFGALLERHGFTWMDGRGMLVEPATWTAKPTRVALEAVTRANVEAYVVAFATGWDLALDVGARCDDVVRALATGRFHFVMARVDGAIAATAGFVVKPAAAYLVGGNVLAPHRGRGIYRALIDHRLGQIRALGLPLAVTQAREATSAPILEALGFETVYRSRMYLQDDPRAAAAKLGG